MAEITSMKQSYVTFGDQNQSFVNVIDLNFDTYNVTTSDTVTIKDFPTMEGFYLRVLQFNTEVVTADGETATADFGLKPITGTSFTADPNGLDDAVNLNSTGVSAGAVGTDAQMGALIPLDGGARLYMTPDHNLEDGRAIVTIVYNICKI